MKYLHDLFSIFVCGDLIVDIYTVTQWEYFYCWYFQKRWKSLIIHQYFIFDNWSSIFTSKHCRYLNNDWKSIFVCDNFVVDINEISETRYLYASLNIVDIYTMTDIIDTDNRCDLCVIFWFYRSDYLELPLHKIIITRI